MSTLYRHLIAEGFTVEQIAEAFAVDTGHREVSLSFFKEKDADEPVVGIAYRGDYRYEEEHGLALLGEKLMRGAEQSSFVFKTSTGQSGVDAFVFSAESSYGSDLDARVAAAVERHARPFNLVPSKVSRMTVKEMRAVLKEKGLSPLPTKRADVEKAYVTKVLGHDEWADYANVGEFHYGDDLVMVVGDPILKAALDYLVSVSAEADSVRLGHSSNPFSRGAMFYDERDLTDETRLREKAEKDEYDRLMGEASDEIAALKEEGYLYSIRPAHLKTVVHRPELGEGDYYFVNYSPRGRSQVFGWFTVEELGQLADGSIDPEKVSR